MEKTYETRNLLAADANKTITIVGAGDTKVPHEFGYFTVLDDTNHTIAFWDGDPTDTESTLICTKLGNMADGTYWFKRPIVRGLYAVIVASYAGNIVVGYN